MNAESSWLLSGIAGRSGEPEASTVLEPHVLAVLPREFYARPVLEVAPDLLGCVISHQTPDGLVAATIVEVEAYAGEVDPASHAFRGKTARNAVMYGEPGHAYVYFTYGMHFCMNLVCQQADHAAAVLLRAGHVIKGADLAASRRAGRSREAPEHLLASGPARLCQALGLDREQNGSDVCDPHGPLKVLSPLEFTGLAPELIARGPRVGVRNGAKEDWRFWIAGHAAVSAYRPHMPRRRSGTTVTPSPAP